MIGFFHVCLCSTLHQFLRAWMRDPLIIVQSQSGFEWDFLVIFHICALTLHFISVCFCCKCALGCGFFMVLSCQKWMKVSGVAVKSSHSPWFKPAAFLYSSTGQWYITFLLGPICPDAVICAYLNLHRSRYFLGPIRLFPLFSYIWRWLA
jgi:hypothetical protein